MGRINAENTNSSPRGTTGVDAGGGGGPGLFAVAALEQQAGPADPG